jgi:glucokinase
VACFLGIEIGGTKLQVVSGNETATILERRKFLVEPANGAAGILRQIEQGLSELDLSEKPGGVGVGFGGPVNWRTGKISRSHHVKGWSGFELGAWLEKLAGAPVRVDNDGNVAALGEARYGAGIGYNPVFYVTLGSGVGGGLILDGHIFHGATPGEAEIGHVRLDRSGTTVESRCSGWAVDAQVRALTMQDASSLLAQLADQSPGAEARHLAAALDKSDPTARRLLEQTAEDLSFGLSHVVHLIHPQMIVLGGGLARLGPVLRVAVENALNRFVMDAFKPGPKIALSILGDDVVPKGALELARLPLVT